MIQAYDAADENAQARVAGGEMRGEYPSRKNPFAGGTRAAAGLDAGHDAGQGSGAAGDAGTGTGAGEGQGA